MNDKTLNSNHFNISLPRHLYFHLWATWLLFIGKCLCLKPCGMVVMAVITPVLQKKLKNVKFTKRFGAATNGCSICKFYF